MIIPKRLSAEVMTHGLWRQLFSTLLSTNSSTMSRECLVFDRCRVYFNNQNLHHYKIFSCHIYTALPRLWQTNFSYVKPLLTLRYAEKTFQMVLVSKYELKVHRIRHFVAASFQFVHQFIYKSMSLYTKHGSMFILWIG